MLNGMMFLLVVFAMLRNREACVYVTLKRGRESVVVSEGVWSLYGKVLYWGWCYGVVMYGWV